MLSQARRLPQWLSGKESVCRFRRCGFDPTVKTKPWRKEWLSTTVFLLGKSHAQKTLAGYSPWDHKELAMTQQGNN